MLGIVKKDALTYLLMAAMAIVFPALSSMRHGFSDKDAVGIAGFMMMAVLLPTVQCETVERLMRGYRFLGILPVTTWEIVWAKHLLPLVAVAVQQINAALLFVAFSPESTLGSWGHRYFAASGAFTLVAAAFVLHLVYRFGLSKAGTAILIVLPVGLAIGIQELHARNRDAAAQSIDRLLSGPQYILMIALCFVAFILLALASARVAERKED